MRLSIYLKENAAQKCFYVLSQYYKAPGGWCSIASDLRLPYKKGVLRKIIRIELLSLSFSMKNDKFHSNRKKEDMTEFKPQIFNYSGLGIKCHGFSATL